MILSLKRTSGCSSSSGRIMSMITNDPGFPCICSRMNAIVHSLTGFWLTAKRISPIRITPVLWAEHPGTMDITCSFGVAFVRPQGSNHSQARTECGNSGTGGYSRQHPQRTFRRRDRFRVWARPQGKVRSRRKRDEPDISLQITATERQGTRRRSKVVSANFSLEKQQLTFRALHCQGRPKSLHPPRCWLGLQHLRFSGNSMAGGGEWSLANKRGGPVA